MRVSVLVRHKPVDHQELEQESGHGAHLFAQGRLPLNAMRLKDIADMAVIQNAFHMITVDRTLTVSAPTRKDKKEWMDDVADAIATLREVRTHELYLAFVALRHPFLCS